MSRKKVPCSDQSLARGDPMYGTASAGSNWLLLELSGAWGPSAFLQSPAIIDPALGRTVVRRAEKAGMRIAAIRRHGRRPATPRWRWYVARAEPGAEALYRGEVDDPPGGCACEDGETRTCPFPGACAASRQLCVAGIWAGCGLMAQEEICGNEVDEDCDRCVVAVRCSPLCNAVWPLVASQPLLLLPWW